MLVLVLAPAPVSSAQLQLKKLYACARARVRGRDEVDASDVAAPPAAVRPPRACDTRPSLRRVCRASRYVAPRGAAVGARPVRSEHLARPEQPPPIASSCAQTVWHAAVTATATGTVHHHHHGVAPRARRQHRVHTAMCTRGTLRTGRGCEPGRFFIIIKKVQLDDETDSCRSGCNNLQPVAANLIYTVVYL